MRVLINFLFVAILFIFVTTAHGYDVILKNGKSIHGTKISEDENLIVLQDASGVRINIKKQNVDSSKTEAANQQTTTIQTSQPASTSTTPKPANSETVIKKKTARKITEEDLKKLREKYDLGEGTFEKESKEDSEKAEEDDSEDDATTEKTEAEWRQEAEMHRQKLKQAQSHYNRLSEQCEKLKQLTTQNDVWVDGQGNELPMQNTSKQLCDLAKSAGEKLDDVRANYSEFTTEAKKNAVPPGWLRDEEDNDPPEE